MHCANFGCRKVTFISPPLKWPPKVSGVRCFVLLNRYVVWMKHDDWWWRSKNWSTCVRRQERIAWMALPVPTPDLEVPRPTPFTTRCSPILIFEGGIWWRTPLRLYEKSYGQKFGLKKSLYPILTWEPKFSPAKTINSEQSSFMVEVWT